MKSNLHALFGRTNRKKKHQIKVTGKAAAFYISDQQRAFEQSRVMEKSLRGNRCAMAAALLSVWSSH